MWGGGGVREGEGEGKGEGVFDSWGKGHWGGLFQSGAKKY